MRGWLMILLIVASGSAWADTFVVTSNAGDFSAGTFGEAINNAAANGTSFTDTILFNLPGGDAGRTIKGQGYRLSSNLVIDGTSQPGAPFGLSDARIHIVPQGNFCTTALLMYSIDHVEMYGLWLSDYSAYGGLSCYTSVIKLRDISQITIGKPGKGNVFSNNYGDIMNDWDFSFKDSTQSTDITVQSNFFGLSPAGDLDNVLYRGGVSFGSAKNVLIGGNDPKEGNLFAEGVGIGNEYVQPQTGNGFIKVINNTFGLDYYRQHNIEYSLLSIMGRYELLSDLEVIIQNNVFGHDTSTNSIWLNNITKSILISGNELGALDDGYYGKYDVCGILFQNCSTTVSALVTNNTIHGYCKGIRNSYSTGVTITQNSIYCNQKGILVYNRPSPPQIILTGVTATTVTGSTTCASCKVEIFSTGQCTQYCQNGQTYLGSATTGSNGAFTYAGAISGQISATVTDADGTTSEFSGARFDQFDANASDASCGKANGSVTGLTVWPATTPVHWVDANEKEVGSTIDLLNVPAGAYRAYVEDAIYGCQTYSSVFTVNNGGAPQADANGFETVLPRCSINNGSLIYTGYHATNTSFNWLDENRNIVKRNSDSLLLLAPGTYYSRLIAGTDNNCYTEYGPFVITNQADTCTGVTISGAAAACFPADTSLAYTGKRNAGCLLPVQWSLGSLSDLVTSVNDSVALYHFNQNGVTKVYAHIEGYCKEFLDSFTVQLYSSVPPVNLGADKTICPGASVTLTAPVNMASYAWQDGSAAQTKIATKPGTYYVTTTDQCQHSTSDTILLLTPSETSLGLLPQYSKCNTDTVEVTLSSSFTNYSFAPASAINAMGESLKAWPSSSTQYTITATTPEGCRIEDKLNIQVYQRAPIYLGRDTAICEGSQITFAVPNGFTSQQWSNGEVSPAIVVRERGSYFVEATDEHECKAADTILLSVNPKPGISLGADRPLCGGKTIVLNAGNPASLYLWQDGLQSQVYTVSQPGLYWVQVTSLQHCTNADTINITGYADLPAGFLEKTDSICTYETKLLQASGSWRSYSWSTGSLQPQTAVKQAGEYWLTVTNNDGCMATDTVQVFEKNCLQDVYIPTGFTPNRDGRNDVFKPVLQIHPAKYYFAVYNRFGQKVFETRNPEQGWNGMNTVSGADDATTYVWYCDYTLPGKAPQLRKGTVVLLR